GDGGEPGAADARRAAVPAVAAATNSAGTHSDFKNLSRGDVHGVLVPATGPTAATRTGAAVADTSATSAAAAEAKDANARYAVRHHPCRGLAELRNEGRHIEVRSSGRTLRQCRRQIADSLQ